jgi:Uncharacterized conserved protein (DUF2190)
MPSWGNFVLDKGLDADAALTKFRAVKMGAAEESVAPIAASTDVAIGVAQFDVTSQDITNKRGASVRMAGISEMETIGAAIARGAMVSISPNGRAKTAATGERVIGIALQAGAATAGVRIAVQLTFPGFLAP